MTQRHPSILPTRRTLLTRLKNWDDQEGWRRFFDTYWNLIYAMARQAGLSDAESQDVVQETVLSVAKQMRGFRYDPTRGTFKSWLRLITRRRIADFQRSRYRQVRQVEPSAAEPHLAALVEGVADSCADDLEALWEAEWRQTLLDAAVRQVRRQVDARQYQMFSCYVLKGWSAAVVAKTLGVSVGQVYLAKHRVGLLVRKEVERLEQGRI
jgi:RNA polymerase sigma factor (sigma-70 family)